MGLDIKLVTADEAYHVKNGSLFRESGVIVTTPPSTKGPTPRHVNKGSGSVFCHNLCDIAMRWPRFEDHTHEHKYGWNPASDSIPDRSQPRQTNPRNDRTDKTGPCDRKNGERPFNFWKNQTGMKTVRVRSQHATMARCALSSMAVC